MRPERNRHQSDHEPGRPRVQEPLDICHRLWDLAAGRVLATFVETSGPDAVLYGAKADRFFVAASIFNRGAVMSMFTGNPVTFLTNVPTALGSHGLAYDETNNLIYTQDQNPNEGALFTFPLPR